MNSVPLLATPVPFETNGSIINYNVWQHLTVTYDGSFAYFYINGEEVERVLRQDATGCHATEIPVSSTAFQIGRSNTTAHVNFDHSSVTDSGDNADFESDPQRGEHIIDIWWSTCVGSWRCA